MDTTSSTIATKRSAELVRQLGLVDSLATVVGSTIGSGIFVVPAIVVSIVKDPTLALLTWFLGGLLSLFGALTLAELGAAKPQTGGIYVYVRDAYGPLAGFLYGWATFWVVQTGSIAAVTAVFGTYLGQLIRLSDFQAKVAALIVIWLLTVLNILGVRYASVVQNVFTSLKLLALLFLVSSSFVLVPASATQFQFSIQPAVLLSEITLLGTGLVGVLFAYEGWTYVTFIGGEIRAPERTLPRAIVLGMMLVVAVYVLTNLAYLRVLSPAAVARSPHVAADVAATLLGRSGGTFITLAILVSTFGAANSCILTGARSYYAMARDNLFFKSLGRVHSRFKTPAYSLLAQAMWCTVLVLSGTYTQLFTYVIFVAWTFYAMAGFAVFIFRRKYSYAEGSYRTLGHPVTTLLFIAAAAGVVLNTMVRNYREALAGLALMVAGLPTYAYWRRRYLAPVISGNG